METLQISIRNPGAMKLIQGLAAMDLINIVSVGGQGDSPPKFDHQPVGAKGIFGDICPSFCEPMEEFEGRETDPKNFVRHAGWGKGTFIIHPSFDEPLEEFKGYE